MQTTNIQHNLGILIIASYLILPSISKPARLFSEFPIKIKQQDNSTANTQIKFHSR